jgi:hypothetical protein
VGIKTNCNHCTKLKVSTQKGSWLANAWRLGDSIDQDPAAFIATSKATREAVK